MLDRQGQFHIIDLGLARFVEDTTITLIGSDFYRL
jgi:hypothetical protein